jgi:4-diphosphocytidyl-2-C-methyl-D-erythritol kinase
LKIAAPAKINLALHVTSQRSDGYHLIESLVAFAHAADQITISAVKTDSLTFSGPFAGLLATDTADNLVLKARDALRAAAIPPCPPVAIHLEKNLPLSSGIGGGSADAAATLKGLNDHWQLGLTPEHLCAIGLRLGADVPMCLHGRPLIAKGIGEIIEPVDLPPFHMLLVNPGVSVSTPAIFKALANKDNQGLPSISPLMEEMSPQATERGSVSAPIRHPRARPEDPDFAPLQTKSGSSGQARRGREGESLPGRLVEYLTATRNDLQTPAIELQPVIAEAIAALEHSGALFARMSGSGATCFGLFADERSRNSAAANIRSRHAQWWFG